MTPRDRHLASLAASAVLLSLLENALPSPIPGVKPGLANIIVLWVMYRHGWRAAAWVALLRVLAGAFLFGSFMTPGFFLALSGSMASLMMLRLCHVLPDRWFGPITYSTCAALAHIGGQVWVAYCWLVPVRVVEILLPVLLAFGCIFGWVNGLIVAKLLNEPSS
ncbi:heptaprenyl diphosphate synthase [Chitinivorax tropicus]|uniref:Heptaprenyl diphosphate synthase n=1 Tax=Chitinivorax tropicus TaxID=714531 RepID=A0A840MSS8_9PROT|nr:heptaprenyl diphosphate synthase [Chitinivorax tropicus]